MKRPTSFALLLLMFLATPAFADCGEMPAAPALLQETQITQSQQESLTPQFRYYFAAIEDYQSCVDGQLGQMYPPPGNMSEEFLNSAEYLAFKSEFDGLLALIENAEAQKLADIERYNALLANVAP